MEEPNTQPDRPHQPGKQPERTLELPRSTHPGFAVPGVPMDPATTRVRRVTRGLVVLVVRLVLPPHFQLPLVPAY